MSPRAPSQRVRRAGMALVMAAAALATAGTAAAQTAPSGSTPAPAAPSFSAFASLTAADGHVAALHEIGGGKVELLVGTSATDLAPAAGIAPLTGLRTSFPVIHVGSDAGGRAVVTYPRCVGIGKASAGARNCDLHVYDIASGTDRLIPGVRRSGRDEYEAVMDRGALLYSALGQKQQLRPDSGLWYRPAGGTERRIARNPGRELALRGTRIAQVITDGAKAGEEPCENTTLVLRSTQGTARAIARDCLYPSSDDPFNHADVWASPSFLGNRLYWARTYSVGPDLLSLDLKTRKVHEARSTVNIFAFQPTAKDAGLALELTAGTVIPDSDWAAANAVVPVGPIVWTPRTKTLLKPVVSIDKNPLA